MKLRDFGFDPKATFEQPTLSDIGGYIEALIGNEEDRPMAFDGPLQIRLNLVHDIQELVDLADTSDIQEMRQISQWLEERKRKARHPTTRSHR